MKTYRFEQTVYYQDNYIREVNLPDKIVFTEYNKYNDNQRFFLSVVKDPSEEMIVIFKDNYTRHIQIGNLLIGYLSNIKPLCDIPLISLDELNELYSKDLRQMYVVNTIYNQRYCDIQNQIIRMCMGTSQEEIKEKIQSDEYNRLNEELKKHEPKYIESICRPIKFVWGGDNGPQVLVDAVQFRSWLDYEKVVDTFLKTECNVFNWDDNPFDKFGQYTVYMGDSSKEYKEKYENRIKEITESAFE